MPPRLRRRGQHSTDTHPVLRVATIARPHGWLWRVANLRSATNLLTYLGAGQTLALSWEVLVAVERMGKGEVFHRSAQ